MIRRRRCFGSSGFFADFTNAENIGLGITVGNGQPGNGVLLHGRDAGHMIRNVRRSFLIPISSSVAAVAKEESERDIVNYEPPTPHALPGRWPELTFL